MFAVVFIAVFGSSMIGASILGVSLNKLALIPLELYLIIKNGKKLRFHIVGQQKTLLLWYFITSLGSLSGIIFSLGYNNSIVEDVTSRAVLQIVSYLLIYIPIALLLWNSKRKDEFALCFKKALIWTARIQAIWGLAQFVLMQTVGFDLNGVAFSGIFGDDWTRYSNMANSSVGIVLRVTGMNHDAAYLGFILVIGFILEYRPIFKFIYVICSMFALSRAAIVGILFVVLYKAFIGVFKTHGMNHSRLKKFAKYGLMVVALLIVFIEIYKRSPSLQAQITRVFERFAVLFLDASSDGSNRHLGYLLAMLQLEIFNVPILQKLVGVGNQCGGILMTYFQDDLRWLGLSKNMINSSYVWTVESDVASAFLETGIIGGALYYYFYYRSYRKAKNDIAKKTLIITLALFGFMYNIAGFAFIQLIYISLFATDFNLSESIVSKENLIKIKSNRKKMLETADAGSTI